MPELLDQIPDLPPEIAAMNPAQREFLENMLRIDLMERQLAQMQPVECHVTHRWTPGLYIREIFMPAGSVVTSKIHKTAHPFVISQGRVSVFSTHEPTVELCAPHTGITTPGTRRAILVHEDTIWTTFHPTDKTTVEEVEADIIHRYENPLLKGVEAPCLGSR